MEMQESTLFVGEFHRTIDEKGRLTIPASWRPRKNHDGNDISYLALPTPDGNITVYSPEDGGSIGSKDFASEYWGYGRAKGDYRTDVNGP